MLVLLLWCHLVTAADVYTRIVPLFLLTETNSQTGVLRLINHSNVQGVIEINAFNNAGVEHGPVRVLLEANQSMLLSASELTNGTGSSEMNGSLGAWSPRVWLTLSSELDFESISYAQRLDGHLEDLSTVVRGENGCWRIPYFAPGSSLSRSTLRLINIGGQTASVQLSARDDRGVIASEYAVVSIEPRHAVEFSAEDLERGNAHLVGSVGKGLGNWQIALQSDQPLSVQSLMTSTEGQLSNLSERATYASGKCWLKETLATADRSIASLLKPHIQEGKSPALFAAIVDEHGVRAIAAEGVRKFEDAVPVSVYDKLHIGSITKPMTTTMLATLVEDGTLTSGWSTAVREVFPELSSGIHTDYRDVTLIQLVKHEGGLNREAIDWDAHGDLDIIERRRAIVRDNLALEPSTPIGSFAYSHLGYVVAAAMAEKVTGETWETLMHERLFVPLEMSSTGFGQPGTADDVSQPWGHTWGDGSWMPTQEDKPQTFAPAGSVHTSLLDLSKFARLWMQGVAPNLLSRATLDYLLIFDGLNAVGSGAANAPGWFLYPKVWGYGIALNHAGSNRRWHAMLWIMRDINRAYIAVANSTDFFDSQTNTPITLPLLNELIESLAKSPSRSVKQPLPTGSRSAQE